MTPYDPNTAAALQESHIELLGRMPIFGGIRGDVLRFLLERSPLVHVAKDEFFFREKDEAESMFVLLTGKVALLKRWQGHDHLVRYLGEGDCFGEMALIDHCSRSASVCAVAPCTAIELFADTLYRLYQTDLEQFAMIQMNMGREVSRRLRETDERLFQALMGNVDAASD